RFPISIIRTARFVDSARRRSGCVPLDSVPVPGTGVRTGKSAPQGLLSPTPNLVVASRTDFDGALLAAAREVGVEVMPARVTDIVPRDDGFRIETTAGARHV